MEHPRIPVYLLIDAEYQICEYNTSDRTLTLSSFPPHMTTALTCFREEEKTSKCNNSSPSISLYSIQNQSYAAYCGVFNPRKLGAIIPCVNTNT